MHLKLSELSRKQKLYAVLWLAIIVLFICEVIAISLTKGVIFVDDSFDYFTAYYSFTHGIIDLYRTPVYPMIVGPLRGLLGPSSGGVAVVAIQYAAYFVAGWYLRRIAMKFIGNEWAAICVVGVFLLFPGQLYYCTMILTESLTASAVVWFTWFLVKSAPKLPTAWDSVRTAFWLIFLMLLRPVMIYLVPVTLVFYGYIWWRNRKSLRSRQGAVSVACMLLAWCVPVVYTGLMHRAYGLHTMSYIGVINNYYTVMAIDRHDYYAIDDPHTRDIATFMNSRRLDFASPYDREGTYWMITYTLPLANPGQFEKYVNSSLKHSRPQVAEIIKNRVLIVNNLKINGNSQVPFGQWLPSFKFYFLTLLVMIVMWVIAWIRTKTVPIEAILLMMITLGLTAATIIGAMGDWERLTMPGIFAYYLLLAKSLQIFRLRPAWPTALLSA